MKRISVKLVGSKVEPFTIHVNPGVTAGEILAQLALEDCVLCIPPAPNRYCDDSEAVYEELLQGDFLLAVPPEGGHRPAIKIDIDAAREELRKLMIPNTPDQEEDVKP